MFPPGSLFLPSHPPRVLQRLLSHLVLLVLSCSREREARTMGFIVFELGASLLCFVSRAIRGANCRSYAIAFCFLLLPPSLHALSFSLAVSLFSCSGTAPVRPRFPLSFLASTPTDTTEHEGGLLSHSPLSSSSRGARSSTLERVSRTYCSSSRRSLVAADFLRSGAENLSFRPLSFPFPRTGDRFLCRVLLFIFRVLAP